MQSLRPSLRTHTAIPSPATPSPAIPSTAIPSTAIPSRALTLMVSVGTLVFAATTVATARSADPYAVPGTAGTTSSIVAAELFEMTPMGTALGYSQEWTGAEPSVRTYGPDPGEGAYQSGGTIVRGAVGRTGAAASSGSGTAFSGAAAYRAAGDTLAFGNVDEDGFAILGDTWTFDHGGADPMEGWFGVDRSTDGVVYGRQITEASWNADPGNPTDAPILSGNGSAWIGAFDSEAGVLCWESGLGYGNDWIQKISSPAYSHNGVSDVTLQWTHFNDTEENFDYAVLYLESVPGGARTEIRRYTGQIGLAVTHPADPPVGAVDSIALTPADFGGQNGFRLVFEVTSDGGWSDEDGFYETDYGPCGLDDVTIDGFGPNGTDVVSYGFENDLEGWTAEPTPGVGHDVGIANSADYPLEDTCRCTIEGNVIEMHNVFEHHTQKQHAYAVSAPVDVLNDVDLPGSGELVIFADWTEYLDLPRNAGVFVRPGWQYYPWTCGTSGEVGWSPRVGSTLQFFWDLPPGCYQSRSFGTGEEGIPPGAEQVRFLYELVADCENVGDPCDYDFTNFTPLLDNVEIRITRAPRVPPIAVDLGLHFQDGFAQGTRINEPGNSGRADVTRNVNFGDTAPFVLGDSLQIAGPVVTTSETRWESNLWFRIARTGPLAGSNYDAWVASVNAATGADIEAGEFAAASMDSVQLGTNAFKNKFATYLKEEDWTTWGRSGSGPELTDEVEIIPDDVLYPGTQVEYFVSANFLDNPGDRFLLPDTSGGHFYEFEILPSWRDVGGGELRYPCLLYIDAANDGTQRIVDLALDGVGLEYDRYDYLDATSNWKAPMARGSSIDANNGCTRLQLFGYRGILLTTGAAGVTQTMWPEDFLFLDDWLTNVWTEVSPRGLVLNGDGIGTILEANAGVMAARLGAQTIAESYAAYSGNPDDCVRIESPSGGGAYGTTNSLEDYETDAWGNACPQELEFDVFTPIGAGVGNRVYVDYPEGTETQFSQIVSAGSGPDPDWQYRTVLDGVSWRHLADPDPDRCIPTEQNIVSAARNEIVSALEWIYSVDVSELPSLCEEPDYIPGAASTPDSGPGWGDGPTTRLHPASPNPFNPRTTLRFSLARDGAVALDVYDVAGRRVRTLVDGLQSAGAHEVVWDGTDDRGQPLASGTYWARLETNGYRSASRMVFLR